MSLYTDPQEEKVEDKEAPRKRNLAKALTLGVAYAAAAGGTGSLMGNGVNPILKGQADAYVCSYKICKTSELSIGLTATF